ncbi:MAG: L,D-transpeptidase family protein [Woeseiaceae bacterium]|nr:L,D-transpeptidase family protein [Woeseiaceae bacterium]
MLIALALTAGCAEFARYPAGSQAPVPVGERPVLEPLHPNRFVVESAEVDVIGEPQVVLTAETDTLSDLAREYGLGYDEIVAANPGVNPWLPGEGTPVLLPTQYVLPDAPREGLVLNIASKRVFYFPTLPIEHSEEDTSQIVLTFPIGIGRVGWETPLGESVIISKAKDPTWYVPASVRREHAEMGDPLPSVVPPGPDNPLGTRVLKLDMPGYLLHGTNQPFGVGMRVSHGCVRLYPENIEYLYELVDIGEPVRIINEPYLLGRRDGEWYFESHAPLEDDTVDPVERLDRLLASVEGRFPPAVQDHARSIASIAHGMPVRLAQYDADEVLARLRQVENTVEIDAEAPTLEEVREMIDEAVAEAEADELADQLADPVADNPGSADTAAAPAAGEGT